VNAETQRLSAALTGRYDIEREIGAGGMATVYLARDVKHKRNVALKVLKPELGAVLGVDRFLAEIQVTANLQHPNLLPLFDSGEAAGRLFYVMPFVEGESLRARLDREKQLPIDEAVRISVAIAGALAYAHEQGVIHRDLKPENILLQAGQPVVADFGIALALSNAGGARVTQTGLSLGTPQYMSPEQATGDRAIDARTDVYSLAAMTYEMLTGEPPHTGTSAQAIIAKLMTEDVRPLTVLRRAVPAHVDGAVRHGLEKLAADRFSTAEDFALALAGARPYLPSRSTTAGRAVASTGTVRSRVVIAALALLAVGATATAVWFGTRPAPTPQLVQFELGLPPGVTVYNGGGTKLAFSNDGTKLVILGVKDGVVSVYLRAMDEPVAQIVRGGERLVLNSYSTVSPSFSPDGEWILLRMASQGIQKLPVVGGVPQALADTGITFSWHRANVVLTATADRLVAMSPDGGARRVVATADAANGIFGFYWPEMLPGGAYALVALSRTRVGAPLDSMHLGLVSMNDGAVTDLGVNGTNPHYVASGHIVFARGTGGLVLAAPFSLPTRQITGPAVVLVEGVWMGGGGAAGFAVADNGAMAYHGGGIGQRRELVVVSTLGVARPIAGDRMQFESPRVSPDGKRVAVNVDARETIVVDPLTGARERLIDVGEGSFAEWTRDGKRVLFTTIGQDRRDVVSRAWDRSGADSVVWRGAPASVTRVVPGLPGGYAAIATLRGTFEWDIKTAAMDSLAVTRSISQGTRRNATPSISADGKTLAWASDESGVFEVYAQPLPGPGARVQVSVNGGVQPVWSKNGSTLFYRGGGAIRSAEIASAPLRIVRRDSLFADSYSSSTGQGETTWDVFPSGQEFLLIRPEPTLSNSVSVILNWQQMKVLQRTATP